jgi:hypothetical protein
MKNADEMPISAPLPRSLQYELAEDLEIIEGD